MVAKLSSIENIQGEVWDHQGKTEVAEIFVSYTDVVFFLQFFYVEEDCLVLSDRLGSSKLGSKFNKVKLNYPHEFLTSISGSFGDYFGRCVVSFITFGTNQGTHGPFGKQYEYDRVFNFQMGSEPGPLGGFHGSTIEGVLESIGVYVKPTPTISSLICAREFNGCRTEA